MLGFNNFLKDEKAAGTLELILIIVVLISLVVLFKRQITNVVSSILNKISGEAGKI